LALLLFVFAAYAGTLRYPFFFDDAHFVVANMAIHTPQNLLKLWTSASYNSSVPDQWGYRPFTTFIHSLSWIAGGGSTVPFHIHKKLLIVTVCLLLVGIWRRIWSWPGFFPTPYPRIRFAWKGKDRVFLVTPLFAAWMLAFVFAIHPANNEVANYVSATTTLLAGTCYAGAYYLYLRWREDDLKRARFLVASLAVYALAVFSKEEGITLCAVVAMTELVAPRRGSRREAIERVLPYFAMGALMAWVLKVQFMESSNGARGDVPRWQYFMTQWRAYIHYFKTIVWPFDLNADNLVFGFSSRFDDPKVLGALFLNLAIVAAALIRRKRNPLFLFALLWFYIGVSPASSIIPLAEPVNERRMFIGYLGLIGIFPWLVKAVETLCRKDPYSPPSKLTGPIVALAFVALLVGCETRSLVWSSQFTLWKDTVEKNPFSGRALNNLSLDYMSRGDRDTARDLLERCERFSPTYSVCKINLALIYGQAGRTAEADVKFREALMNEPGRVDTRNYYADYLMLAGRYETALQLYREAYQLTNGMNLQARVGWIKAAWLLGRAEEARALLEESRKVLGPVPELVGLVPEGAPTGGSGAGGL
jgi:tetratricopeptide (TPR) repeat protein